MFPPAIIYILIQLVGLYGAYRLGHEGVSCDSKGKKKKNSIDIQRTFKNEPVNSWMVIVFLGISLLIAMTNVSSFGSMGGGYSGGYGY